MAKSVSELYAPFPYWGGKRRAAAEVWKRFGPVTTYIEPFAGSLAVLLACPYGERPREVVNDMDGFVSNFWRSLRADPELVAYYADWPTSHLDLTARKQFCVNKLARLTDELRSDMDYYDAEVAGYWVWCVSNDIGLFREGQVIPDVAKEPVDLTASDSIPVMGDKGVNAQRVYNRKPTTANAGGLGVQPQKVSDRRAKLNHGTGGNGVQAQSQTIYNRIPVAGDKGVQAGRVLRNIPHATAAQGIQAQRDGYESRPLLGPLGVNTSRKGYTYPEAVSEFNELVWEHLPFNGKRLFAQFTELAERLWRTYVLCKDWSTLCSPSVMGLTNSDLKGSKKPVCGIFLDPPYQTEGRKDGLYRVDSLSVAADVMQWAIEKGNDPNIRVAVAGYKDDYSNWPEGWEAYEWSTSEIRMGSTKRAEYSRVEVIWFSPHCQVGEDKRSQTSFLDELGL